MLEFAKPNCHYCGGTGNKHNGYFQYLCNCVRIPSQGEITEVEYGGFEFKPSPLKGLFVAKKQVKEYLESLSRTELIKLLEEAGFEVEDGDGKVIFTDKVIIPKTKTVGTIESTFTDKRNKK